MSPDRSENASDVVTIVAGLPRSGTSLMMQMLGAGGLPVLTDGVRGADDDNPRGYAEYEPVKRTREDASWLAGAAGKVVKMVHVLLYDLPAGRPYRVVVMRRDLREVVRSQRVMLERRGTTGAALSDEQLIAAYDRQLAKLETWLAEQPNVTSIQVDYNRLVATPDVVADEVNVFLGGGLDVAAMRAVVDPSLYRQRVESR